MKKEEQNAVLKKEPKEDKFSRLSLALKNNLLRRKSKNKFSKQEELKK